MLMSAMSGFKNVENIIKVAHESKVSELNTILAREGNLEKIIKANTDKVYRNELLKKYRLLK